MARIARVAGIATAAAAGALAGPALGQEYCVSCSEPGAVYRCVIEGAKPGGAQSLQMLCVTRMAQDGGHAACSIKRGTVFECDGPVKRVPWASLGGQAEPKGADAAATRPEPDPNEPPKTLVDMAKRANEQTAEQMKKAGENVKEGVKTTGETIGSATKKTWDCLFSLFKQC